MLEKLNVPVGIDGVKARGTLSKADYENVLEPMLERARNESRRLRLLFELGSDFEGLDPGAVWEDARLGLRYIRPVEACAIVTDLAWLREAARLAHFILPCPIRVFGYHERELGIAWLRAVPDGASVSFRMIANSGVLVVEVKEALRDHDFDALALTADSWIEAHGKLQGVIIRCKEFHGWENLTSLIRHVRFVRDHEHNVQRVALVADGELVSLVTHLAAYFVRAEIKSFRYHDLDAAAEWTLGPVDAPPS